MGLLKICCIDGTDLIIKIVAKDVAWNKKYYLKLQKKNVEIVDVRIKNGSEVGKGIFLLIPLLPLDSIPYLAYQ